MNDFTKKELKAILEGISWWLEGDYAHESKALINKIELIIEKYCEHVWEGKLDKNNSGFLYCDKCGATHDN